MKASTFRKACETVLFDTPERAASRLRRALPEVRWDVVAGDSRVRIRAQDGENEHSATLS